MSLLFMEGFDGTNKGEFPIFDVDTLSYTRATSYGRRGTNGIYASSYTSSTAYVEKLVGDKSNLIVGMAINPRYTGHSTTLIYNKLLAFMDGLVEQAVVCWANSALTVLLRAPGAAGVPGAILATASADLTLQVWNYLEVKIGIHPTAGTFQVKVNGVEILNASGLNTDPNNSGKITSFRLWPTNARPYFDDFYVLDTLGTSMNDFLGDVIIETLLPSADGTKNDWIKSVGTSGYVLIDENNPTSTDHIVSGTLGAEQTFRVNIIPDGRNILAVQQTTFAHSPEGVPQNFQAIHLIGATKTLGDVAVAESTKKRYDQMWISNPVTGVAWTDSELATTEFGFRIPAGA